MMTLVLGITIWSEKLTLFIQLFCFLEIRVYLAQGEFVNLMDWILKTVESLSKTKIYNIIGAYHKNLKIPLSEQGEGELLRDLTSGTWTDTNSSVLVLPDSEMNFIFFTDHTNSLDSRNGYRPRRPPSNIIRA